MKRFWNTATLHSTDAGHAVLLDGKPLRIPGRAGGAPLSIPTLPLAEAITAEWQAAGGAKDGELSMEHVPLTRLAGTAQDRILPYPAPVAAALAAYGESDLLCYRAEHPEELVRRQAQAWDPWLDWAAEVCGARLRVAQGVMHVKQDPAALQAIQGAYANQAVPVLAALSIAVPALGSAVLGLALADGALDAAEAHRIAGLDEAFQTEKWGEDSESAIRRQRTADDIALAEQFIRLSRVN
ncbi:MAG TPA: ATP12 family protein [Acetobacteraceae bacterium]